MSLRFRAAVSAALVAPALLTATSLHAQDRLKSMPGYAQYERMRVPMQTAVKLGALNVTWAPDGRSFEYLQDGKRLRYDVAARKATETTAPPAAGNRFGGRGPERGRQVSSTLSPDSTRKAFYRDRNLYVSDTS